MSIAVFEVGLPVVAADPGRTASDDHSVSALVEDLGDGGFERVAAAVLVEGDSDVAGGRSRSGCAAAATVCHPLCNTRRRGGSRLGWPRPDGWAGRRAISPRPRCCGG